MNDKNMPLMMIGCRAKLEEIEIKYNITKKEYK